MKDSEETTHIYLASIDMNFVDKRTASWPNLYSQRMSYKTGVKVFHIFAIDDVMS